jgi:phosphohistidine phosphatase
MNLKVYRKRGVTMLRLYLVQHGEAKPQSEDPERPLTEQGRLDVARVAAFAQRAGVDVHQIRHSGKRRAEETAAILAEHLQPADGVVAIEGLAPMGDVRRVAELLGRETSPLMFVGHRPFMDRLAGLLVASDKDCAVVRFFKGGIVCLERDPTTWTWAVRWVVTPDLVPQE